MSRYASEGSGRYDHLHGDEDEIAASRVERVSSCHECGSTDGCLCDYRRSDAALTARISAARANVERLIAADPELVESLDIVRGTAEDMQAEAEWLDREQLETGADRCPTRE